MCVCDDIGVCVYLFVSVYTEPICFGGLLSVGERLDQPRHVLYIYFGMFVFMHVV